MQPLDLSATPPRKPRAELAGIVFLPRSIDKVRALLPGGNPGLYVIPGFTGRMLETFGISLEAFTEAVAAAPDEASVADFVLARTSQEKRDEWNGYALQREAAGGDRARALERYPWLHDRPDLRLALDVLEEDDRQTYAAASG